MPWLFGFKTSGITVYFLGKSLCLATQEANDAERVLVVKLRVACGACRPTAIVGSTALVPVINVVTSLHI